MKFKDKVVKTIEDFNPVAVSRQKRMRARLKADSVSFFTPNCLGGLLFHDLGLQFRSPTVNLMLLQTDFAKFMLDMEAYLKKEFVFFEKQRPQIERPFTFSIIVSSPHCFLFIPFGLLASHTAPCPRFP